MYTECPGCQTYFKITPIQLKAAGGKVRCGNCNEVFSALDGLVDVVPDDAVSGVAADDGASNDTAVSQVSGLSSDSGIQEPVSEAEKSSISGFTELAIEDSSINEELSASFADVEVPGVSEAVEENFELELASAVVEEPAPDAGDLGVETNTSAEEQSIAQQKEINDDIDAALDGLFDEDSQINTEPALDAAPSSAEKADVTAIMSTISEIEELKGLDFGDLGDDKTSEPEIDLNELPSAADITKNSEFDIPTSEAMSPQGINDDKRKVEKEQDKKITELDDSSFDLGDSFIDPIDDVAKPSDNKLFEEDEKESDLYSGDSFILEELDESKSKKTNPIVKLIWVFVILVLLTTLLGQFAYLKRQELASYPELKPHIEKMCMTLNEFYPCEIPVPKDVSAIELLERNVVSHPNADNALLITSTIENKAAFDQPYPNLTLTFSDINQKIIAKRKFSPNEYLSKDVDIEEGMKKNVPIKLMLEIVDPGEEAVNFEFNFQ